MLPMRTVCVRKKCDAKPIKLFASLQHVLLITLLGPSLIESFSINNEGTLLSSSSRSLSFKLSSATTDNDNDTYSPIDNNMGMMTTSSLDDEALPQELTTKQYFSIIEKNVTKKKNSGKWWNIRRNQQQQQQGGKTNDLQREQKLYFDYDYDELILSSSNGTSASTTSKEKSATGIILIHPIGVGISKWFYHRLIKAMALQYKVSNADDNEDTNNASSSSSSSDSYIVVVPDLLGSGSAIDPTINDEQIKKLPLLNITDWSHQILHLMDHVERQHPLVSNWCIVANGGCSPIALQVAAACTKQPNSSNNELPTKKKKKKKTPNVTNVVLSSVPRLPFFIKPSTDPIKTAKSYQTLSGLAGNLFWWYACRKEGRFIGKFSEKNLVADPANLGSLWQKNCYETAISNHGKSRYATFAFLAGTLQDGCSLSLERLGNSNVQVDVIKGRDIRRNQARSWFWLKSKKSASKSISKESKEKDKNDDSVVGETPRKTLRDFLQENGNGGRERIIGGRVSLAHEDAIGYAESLFDFLR